jgi:hypothetical protein
MSNKFRTLSLVLLTFTILLLYPSNWNRKDWEPLLSMALVLLLRSWGIMINHAFQTGQLSFNKFFRMKKSVKRLIHRTFGRLWKR